ncbi:cytochrome P450 [Gemmatimonadetes bacterium T265]|nr:cytochrome P450 [Gemmatimonadetes bacterium T265]
MLSDARGPDAPVPAAARRPPLARAAWPIAWGVSLARDPLGTVQALHAAYGDVVRMRALGRTFVVVAHPDAAREVLVTQQKRFARGYAHLGLKLFLGEGLLTSEGELHRRHRRMAQPAFHRERVAGYARAMVAAAVAWDARWRARADPAAPLDVAAEMLALTLGIAGETLFGADVGDRAAEVAEALGDALRAAPLAFVPFGGWALRLPIPIARRFRRGRARLDRIVYGMIAERRAAAARGEPTDRGDLLSMLLAARDDGTDASGPAADAAAGAAALSDAELRDEVMTIFLAGHETTASALGWTWYLLGTNPDVEARLHAELDAVLGSGAGRRAPTADDVPALSYTRAVIAESMRLFPPAYAIGRRCVERTTLGGYVIEPGWGVVASPWLAHHDPRWWPDPERFAPERWLDAEAAAARPRFAYFPFGGGSRICIGEQFAWTETTLVLATLASRWSVRLAPGPAPRPRGAVTLRPVGGVRAIVTERDPVPFD